jgi:CHRD domain-containing protein
MRNIVRLAAGAAAAAIVIVFAASCGDDNSTGPGVRTYTATLFATNEVAPTASTGTGIAFFVDNTTQIDWTLTLDDITEVTMSHIHGPALPNANAGIIFNLYVPAAATGSLNDFTTSGSITGSPSVSLDSLRTLFNNGRAYVNVHTTTLPAGAIRGQVVRTN